MSVALPAPAEIAWVIAGETSLCSPEAQIAAVHVLRNRARLPWIVRWNQGWYGWQEPSAEIIERTRQALEMDDTSGGAHFLFSRQDVEKVTEDGHPRSGYEWLVGYQPVKRWPCPGEGPDEWVEAWAKS